MSTEIITKLNPSTHHTDESKLNVIKIIYAVIEDITAIRTHSPSLATVRNMDNK